MKDEEADDVDVCETIRRIWCASASLFQKQSSASSRKAPSLQFNSRLGNKAMGLVHYFQHHRNVQTSADSSGMGFCMAKLLFTTALYIFLSGSGLLPLSLSASFYLLVAR